MTVSEAPRVVWSDEQKDIIEADPSGFLLVDAPPGTGKTAVACARVADLLDQGVDPSNVMLLSFTRTAVAELRDRIGSHCETPELAAAVRITTLDSTCWSLLYGFTDDEVKSLFGDYDANIERVTSMMRGRHAELVEYFDGFEHIIVDEAQDLTGARALFVIELLKVVPEHCGATVFADPAQAIYGFTTADADIASSESGRQRTLVEKLHRNPFAGMGERGLTHVYRTDSKRLIDLFLRVRKDLLQTDRDPYDRYDDVKEAIRDAAVGRVGLIDKAAADLSDDGLVLYRRRVEVCNASSYLSNAGIPHRIRMSGTPTCIPAWVGGALAGISTDEMDRTRFREAFSRLGEDLAMSAGGEAQAWSLLASVAGDGRGGVNAKRLRSVLSRTRPPSELCHAELGHSGPIVGTIHASKGREAGEVHLMLPTIEFPEDKTDYEEESRVLYVGATRARDRLKVGKGYNFVAPSLDSGRVFRFTSKKTAAQVEYGRDGDLNLPWIVSRKRPVEDVRRVQSFLATCTFRDVRLAAFSPPPDFHYLIRVDDPDQLDVPIARFGEGVKGDIFEIAKRSHHFFKRKLKAGFSVKHLWMVGVRTVVLPHDHPELDRLHRPYCDSGMFLAPVVKGFTQIYLKG